MWFDTINGVSFMSSARRPSANGSYSTAGKMPFSRSQDEKPAWKISESATSQGRSLTKFFAATCTLPAYKPPAAIVAPTKLESDFATMIGKRPRWLLRLSEYFALDTSCGLALTFLKRYSMHILFNRRGAGSPNKVLKSWIRNPSLGEYRSITHRVASICRAMSPRMPYQASTISTTMPSSKGPSLSTPNSEHSTVLVTHLSRSSLLGSFVRRGGESYLATLPGGWPEEGRAAANNTAAAASALMPSRSPPASAARGRAASPAA
mmetsp:Transcript_118202/g.339093  ORF Transcript_118202/g.339093 Transcript_118202/m.339093 type:complete len:264 (+) Transcript_118202:769-1560(+)